MYRRKKEKKQKLSEFGESVYAAEKLIDRRKKKNGKIEYLVKWRGYSMRDCSWEPEINIIDERLIEDFEKNHLQKTKNDQTTKSSTKKVIQKKAKETPSSSKSEKDEETISSKEEQKVPKKILENETRDEKRAANVTETSENLEGSEQQIKNESTSAIEDNKSEYAIDQETIQDEIIYPNLTVNVEEHVEEVDDRNVEEIERESDQLKEIEEETTVDPETIIISTTSLRMPEVNKIAIQQTIKQSITENSIISSNRPQSIQILNRPINSSNRIKQNNQTSLLKSNDLSSMNVQKNESLNRLTNQTVFKVQSSKQTKNIPIVNRSFMINQMNSVKNQSLIEPDEVDDLNCNNSLDNSLDNNLSFNVVNLTNSMLCHNSGNISGNNLSNNNFLSYHHNSLSTSSSPYNLIHLAPSSSNKSSLSNQIGQQKTIINPSLIKTNKSSTFKDNNRISHNLVNIVQPIPSNLNKMIINQVNRNTHPIQKINLPIINQQIVSPVNKSSLLLNRKSETDHQIINNESTKLTSFQETSNAILNSKRLVQKHQPPSLFWRNNSILANELVITDVINDDNVAVTIRECKIQEFFREKNSKKKKPSIKI